MSWDSICIGHERHHMLNCHHPVIHSSNLQRCFFIIRRAINLLDSQFETDPLEFGWPEVDGYIVPDKQLLPLPNFYLVRCGCTKKCTGHCSCARQDVACTQFCKCKRKCSNLPWYFALPFFYIVQELSYLYKIQLRGSVCEFSFWNVVAGKKTSILLNQRYILLYFCH